MFYKKKSLGQSFLIDSNIAKKIVSSLTLNSSNYVIEVGPGKGILTKYLVNTYKNVYLIEIDRRLIIYLKYRFPKLMHNILHKNFLYWIPNNKLTSFGLIGNFPYYISSEIILKILSIRYYVIECVGMFQKEFADKLIFKNNKYFNSLSVLINAFYNIEFLFSVDKCYFTPQPRVISYVLRLKRKKNINFNYNIFYKIVIKAFSHKRKMLRNSLKSFIFCKEVYNYNFLDKRPQELSIDDYIFLTNNIYSL